jgi:hypothetical protein
MSRDFWTYAKFVISKRITSAVSVVSLGLAIYNGLRKPTDPAVLPIWAWITLGVGSLMAAQFLVWRDLWAVPVDADHDTTLRQIAAAGGKIETPFLQRAFAAHFPRISELRTTADSTSEADRLAVTPFVSAARASAQRFLESDGWNPTAIGGHAVGTLAGGALYNNAPPHLPLEFGPGGKTLVWGAGVIWTGDPGDNGGRRDVIRDWVLELFDSPEAEAVRNARATAREAGNTLREALDSVVHSPPIRNARKCEVCNPPKSA